MKLFFSILFISVVTQAQDMSIADNQCRAEAKELAIKSYQSCITEARTARLENIRKEYQEKLAELKKQYDSQLQDLKKSNTEKSTENKAEPTVTLKKAKSDKKVAKSPKKMNKKSAGNIITEAELEKSAPVVPVADSAQATTVETNTTTGETENLQMVDPSLPSEQ